MAERLLVTIVTATLNNVEGLKRTVMSVASQALQDLERVVIDGGPHTLHWPPYLAYRRVRAPANREPKT